MRLDATLEFNQPACPNDDCYPANLSVFRSVSARVRKAGNSSAGTSAFSR